MATLLSIISDLTAERGLVTPTSVIDSDDQTVKQFLALSNKEGRDSQRRFNWQALMMETTFITLDGAEQTTLTAAAADFGRFINGSMFNQTSGWRVFGPMSPEEWQAAQANGVQVGVGNNFRIRGDSILFYPAPTADETIAFEYISKNWCESSTGTGQETWAADTDVLRLDEHVHKLGVMWRFLKAKGLDYSEEFASYERSLEQIFGIDGARGPIDMTGCYGNGYADPYIPEGNWAIY